ncbi:MAG: hypothetical protein WC415_06655 [Patescibacteria group bacterium]|jgi:hypothetical protein
MTKDDWKRVEDSLSGLWGSVEMLVDGHTVSFYKKQIEKNRLGIMTYVDGWYRGKWSTDDPEIKYLRHVEKSIWTNKEIEKMKKIYGKRQWNRVKDKYDQKIASVSPLWPSVSSICRYYEKAFKSIKLVEINGHAVAPAPTGDINGETI